MITVQMHGLYLDRIGRQVGIVKDRGERERWRWLTTRGYYVLDDGRAALRGESVCDLVADVTIRREHSDGMDSIIGAPV